jgi:hypothetical protein
MRNAFGAEPGICCQTHALIGQHRRSEVVGDTSPTNTDGHLCRTKQMPRPRLKFARRNPIEWRFAEASAANATRTLLQDANVTGINIVHVP